MKTTKRQQSQDTIEQFYRSKDDPWGYFSNPHDRLRKEILLSELAGHRLGRVLDIGCGNGFISESLAAETVVGVDISHVAIEEARQRSTRPTVQYLAGSLFELPGLALGTFDSVVITGVLYSQYIGTSLPLVYRLVDDVLREGGLLISVHIDGWYAARFPYARVRALRYPYRQYVHLLEMYRK